MKKKKKNKEREALSLKSKQVLGFNDFYLFCCQWYYDKWLQTGKLPRSPWIWRLIEIHGTKEGVIEFLGGELEHAEKQKVER